MRRSGAGRGPVYSVARTIETPCAMTSSTGMRNPLVESLIPRMPPLWNVSVEQERSKYAHVVAGAEELVKVFLGVRG